MDNGQQHYYGRKGSALSSGSKGPPQTGTTARLPGVPMAQGTPPSMHSTRGPSSSSLSALAVSASASWQLSSLSMPILPRGQHGPRSGMISNQPALPRTPASYSITNPARPDIEFEGSNVEEPQHYNQFNTAVANPAHMKTLLRQPLRSDDAPYMEQHYRRQAMASSPKSTTKQLESPLGILNAEQYDLQGASVRNARRQSFRQQQDHQTMQIQYGGLIVQKEEMSRNGQFEKAEARRSSNGDDGTTEKRRKRQKKSSEEEAEEDEAKKSRGRPRLDTKDETAADRRRTQIRMAQRAYRHRKETTISSLEKQVNELKAANEQMSSIFLGLHDFAVGRGLVDRDPEFGNQLKSTTERVLALAKSIGSDETGRDDAGSSGEGSKQGHSGPDHGADQPQRVLDQEPQSAQLGAPSASGNSVWGYQIANDGSEPQPSQPEWRADTFEPFAAPVAPARPGHQIITQATSDNASFGHQLLNDWHFNDFQQYRAEVPEVADYNKAWNFPEILPLPNTLSHQEVTFGRYLQRATLERGCMLINAEQPPPVRLLQVFGFCMRFETKEAIRERMNASVRKTANDPLFNWRHPFTHLGGAGTYYPLDEKMSPRMPQFDGGMSTGPWTPEVYEAREKAMLDAFRISLPGFDGQIFDANDVEGYLRGRGINIPPHTEFVTVNLDLVDVGETSSSPSTEVNDSGQTKAMTSTRASSISQYGHQGYDKTQLEKLEHAGDINNMNMSLFSEWNPETAETVDNSDNLNSSRFSEWNPEPSRDTNDYSNLPEATLGNPSQQHAHHPGFKGNFTAAAGRLVTLSVATLVEDLISRALCLGRTPGFRAADVEQALRKNLQPTC